MMISKSRKEVCKMRVFRMLLMEDERDYFYFMVKVRIIEELGLVTEVIKGKTSFEILMMMWRRN